MVAGNQDLLPGRPMAAATISASSRSWMGRSGRLFKLGHNGILDDKFQVFRDQLLRDAELNAQDAPDLLKNLGAGDEFMGRQTRPGRRRHTAHGS